MSSFTSYYFECNANSHRAKECRKRSRKNNIGSHGNHAYEKNVSRSRYKHVPSPGYTNVVYHNYNGFGHREFECKKRNLQSHGGRYNYPLQKGEFRAFGSQRPAWSQRRNVPAREKGPPILVAKHNNMTRRR